MSERMSDAELRALVVIPLDNAMEALSQEVNRARAAELALAARVAELEAATAGMTGTPTHYGRYWCAMDGGVYGKGFAMLTFDNGRWWGVGTRYSFPVLRHWRLPGETYTEAPVVRRAGCPPVQEFEVEA